MSRGSRRWSSPNAPTPWHQDVPYWPVEGALLGRRAPEIRHLRRWFRPIVQALGSEHLLIGGWFAASSAGALFGGMDEEEQSYRYIEVGLES